MRILTQAFLSLVFSLNKCVRGDHEDASCQTLPHPHIGHFLNS